VSNGKPTWRRVFDNVERKIGEPLEDAAGSSTYVDVIVRGMKLQRAVGGAVGRVAGGAVNAVLRVANLPTRNDIAKLSRQVTVLTGEVRQLKTDRLSPTATPQSAQRTRAKQAARAKKEAGDSP
jgi:outer membrane murein-binding lipoprotein Lpp